MNYIQIFGSISSMLNLNSNLVELEPKTIHQFHLVFV